MCGRYVFNPDRNFYDRFQIENRIDNLTPSFNVAPGNIMPVIVRREGRNVLLLMTWGYIPAWAKSDNKIRLINTRSDSLLQKPSFHKAFESQRCLVPATGFYEWQKKTTQKIPFYFSLKNNQTFAFAGIFNKDTYSIITTDANDAVSPIHERMPVILRPEDESKWVDNSVDIPALVPLLKSVSSEELQSYSVSTKINYPQENSPDLIKPAT